MTRVELDEATRDLADASIVPSSDVLAISSNARITAVKERRLRWIFSPPSPVVVGKIALVAALVAQKLLVGPHVVTVPGKKVGLQFSQQSR